MTQDLTKSLHTIAVVEDDPALRHALGRLLRVSEYPVELYESAEALLERGRFEQIGCLISDIRLPGICGLELQRQLRSTASALPVVLMTAEPEEAGRRRAVEAGAVAYLEKPVQAELLLNAVEFSMLLTSAGRARA